MDSHGLLSKSIDKTLLEILRKECLNYLAENINIINYSSEIASYSKNISLIINDSLISKVSELLNSKEFEICAVELHVQRSNCRPIPPHQDNFYHCIDPRKGLKILIPLQKLSTFNGGLIYLDNEIDFPVLNHSASKIENFSAYIEEESFSKLKNKQTSYDLELGDSVFHFLNSIHFSLGNNSTTDSMFLVYRFQCNNSKINKLAEKNYLECYELHLQNLKEL